MVVGRDLATYMGMIVTSSEGITWASPAPGTTNWLWGIAFGNNQFVAVGNAGTIVSSPDGLTWTNRLSVTDTRLLCIANGDNTFVAAGADGTVLQSDVVVSTQPVLGPPVFLSGGAVQITLTGLVGQTYPIQASTTLSNWLTVTNVALTNTSVQFIDPSATNFPRRFYRAVVQ